MRERAGRGAEGGMGLEGGGRAGVGGRTAARSAGIEVMFGQGEGSMTVSCSWVGLGGHERMALHCLGSYAMACDVILCTGW